MPKTNPPNSNPAQTPSTDNTATSDNDVILSGEIGDLIDSLSTHVDDTDNPHGVTAAQTGAYTTTQADARFAQTAVATTFQKAVTVQGPLDAARSDTHECIRLGYGQDYSNPYMSAWHGTTALGHLLFYPKSVEITAQGGQSFKLLGTDQAYIQYGSAIGHITHTRRPTGDVGTYAMMRKPSGAAVPGHEYAGTELRYSGSNGATASNVPAGTWRCAGYTSSGSHATLFMRVK